MPRLTKEEIRHHRRWLGKWRKAPEMLGYANGLMNGMANQHGIDVDLFTQAGVDFITEAGAAADFAEARGADGVRLILEDWPDLEFRFGHRVERFEFTEADEIDRERGREYKEAAGRVAAGGAARKDDPVEDWVAQANQVPIVLRDRATRKAGKAYPPGTNLLIYLNINEFGIRQPEIEACMADATAPAKDAFAAVWALWKGQAYHLWQDGQCVGERG